MLERIKYAYQQNKVVSIIGTVIFALAFIAMTLLTINAFLGGAIFNRQTETVYNLGENSYGKLRYTGEVSDNKLNGNGVLEIDGDKLAISLNGTFLENNFISGIIDIRDYVNRKNAVLVGNFVDNKITDGYLRFEDKDGNAGIYKGEFTDGELNGIGSVYYLMESTDTAAEMTGNFKEGKLITPESFNETHLSLAEEES